MIKLFGDMEYVPFEITKFPDGTSQAWRMQEADVDRVKINWIWENNESELFHLLTLIDLVRHNGYIRGKDSPRIHLNMPYLPYARQDKKMNNDQTFSLHTFAKVIASQNLHTITSYDAHSSVAKELIPNFYSDKPFYFHKYVKETFQPDIIFYPDQGAYFRYNKADPDNIVLYGEKVRDWTTGKIHSYKLININHFDLKDKKILIIDDICDGGATFINAANELNKYFPKEIALCVSHGVFSKGLDEMKAAGISKFFYTNSLVKNTEGFPVYE